MTSDEFMLALACCRWCYCPSGQDEIVRLSRSIDWDRFVRIIRRHRIQGLVAYAISRSSVSPPDRAARSLSVDASEIAKRNLRFASESFRIFDEFTAAAMSVLFIKGLTLSSLVYGDPFRKMSADLDLLVDADHLPRAASLLSDLGYRLTHPAFEPKSAELEKWHCRSKESVWHHSKSGVILELHTRLSDNVALIPDIGMSSLRQNVKIGRVHSLPTLADEDLFTYLSVHGASSAWFRLKWIVDFAALVYRCDDGEIEGLYRRAQALKAGRGPAQALLLGDRLSLLRLPIRLKAELEADAANRLLAGMALRQLLNTKEPTKRPFGTATIHLSQLFLNKGLKFKVSEVSRQIRSIAAGRH